MTDPGVRRVVDASVAVKWLVPEGGSVAAEELCEFDLHAPTLLQIEVGNVLRTLATRGTLSEAEAKEVFDLLLDVPLTWHEPGPDLMRGALRIALALGHPIYDCLYLALAIDLGAPLVTADRPFHRAISGDSDLDGIVGLLQST